jgi:hypothetical protein
MSSQSQTTAEQRHHFWTSVQDTLATIASQADNYLPDADGDDALDGQAVEEIQNVLAQARASADMAAGAYTRVLRQGSGNGENHAAGRQAAPYRTHVGITPAQSW